MAGIGHRGFMGRNKQVSPVPLSDLSFWYEFDNASKITEDGTNIQEILSSGDNAWAATPNANDPVYSAANGYAQFVAAGSQALISERFLSASYVGTSKSTYTSGFFMMVLELDALVNLRYVASFNYIGATGGGSNDTCGIRISGSGGSARLQYGGRITSSTSTFTNLTSINTVTTGTKYLVQVYVTGGNLYFELDGVAQANNATGDHFPGILNNSASLAYRFDFGGIQSAGAAYTYGGSAKIYEAISYQAYDATKYAQVETYLKTKYGIT